MNILVTDQRIVRATPATLSWQYTDENGVAADPGTVTVGVTKADGTVLVAAGTATNGTGTNPRTYSLAGLATLELLTATWTLVASGLTFSTLVDVAGRFYFTVADARASDTTLVDTTKYPDADIIRVRHEVEDEFEGIADIAYVPRYRRITLTGSGTRDLVLEDNRLRTIRTVRVYSDATTFTSFTATDLANLTVDEDFAIHRPNGAVFDDTRTGNTVIEYEYGFDAPPFDLKRAMLTRFRDRINMARSAIPDRAEQWSSGKDGSLYKLAMPGPYQTGLPQVDAVYERYSRRAILPGQPRPAAGSVNFDPQRYSLYHGPRR